MSVMDFGVRENVQKSPHSPCLAEIRAFNPSILNHLIFDFEARGTYGDDTLNCISKACWCYSDEYSAPGDLPDLYTDDRDEMVAWNRFSNIVNRLVDERFPSIAMIFQWQFQDSSGNMRKLADVWQERKEYDSAEVILNWKIETYIAHLIENVYAVPGGTILTPETETYRFCGITTAWGVNYLE
tara:strand:- start:52 stop:603 length:552 start_codon:yes stop_codon:yes gene_type:complete